MRPPSIALALFLATGFLGCAGQPDQTVEQALSATASPNGARIRAAGALTTIVDASGARWTLSNGKVLKNGTAAGYTGGVTMLLYYDGVLYQENAAGSFWSWNGTAWVGAEDPRAVSIEGAALPAISTIVDSALDVWVLSGTTLYENGVASSTGCIGLVLFKGSLYEELSTYTWASYNGEAWIARGALGDPRVPSASGANVPASSYLIDSSHAVWTIVNAEAYRSGGLAGVTSGVVELEYVGGIVYQKNGAGKYWSWNGTGWTAASTPVTAPTPPAAVASVGYTDAVFLDDFTSLATIDMSNTKTPGFDWYTESATSGTVTDPARITIVEVDGKSALRLDGAGATLTGVQKYEGAAIGPSFALKNGGGAYFEANIAYGAPSTEKVSPWPAWWASSRSHMANLPTPWTGASNPGYTHYLEFDFMEYFTANKSDNYNSTVIDWYGEWGTETSTCDSTSYCKVQETQNLGPGKAGTFTSTESAPVFHKYGALWVPSTDESNGAYSEGYIQWFLDGQPIGDKIPFTGVPSTTDLVPKAPWLYSVIDSEPLALVLGTGSGAFMYVDYAAVWQKP